MELKNNKAFSLREVKMSDAYMENAFAKEVAYLTAFDTDKLLAGFRETACRKNGIFVWCRTFGQEQCGTAV